MNREEDAATKLMDPQFWQVVQTIFKQRRVHIPEFCEQMEISQGTFEGYKLFFRNIGVKVIKDTVKVFEVEIPEIEFSMSLYHWVLFQAHFPFLTYAQDAPFYNEFTSALAGLENKFEQSDLFSAIRLFENYKHSFEEITSTIYQGIDQKRSIELKVRNSSYEGVCHKILYLENDLVVITESVEDGSLSTIPLSSIEDYKLGDSHKSCLHGQDVEDFIKGVREIAESDIRLILKSGIPKDFYSVPDHHYFGSPCLITNPKGEFIWAASVEVHDDVFEWVSELGEGVEVLEPLSFKKQYLNYCEKKLKKIA